MSRCEQLRTSEVAVASSRGRHVVSANRPRPSRRQQPGPRRLHARPLCALTQIESASVKRPLPSQSSASRRGPAGPRAGPARDYTAPGPPDVYSRAEVPTCANF